jgi:hypothetical protein
MNMTATSINRIEVKPTFPMMMMSMKTSSEVPLLSERNTTMSSTASVTGLTTSSSSTSSTTTSTIHYNVTDNETSS